MPSQLTNAVPTPAGPTPEERRTALGWDMHVIGLVVDYLRKEKKERTQKHDDEAARTLGERASSIFDHFEACPALAAGFPDELRDILHKLAVAHREHLENLPPPPPPRKSATRDPRKRPPPEPVVATAEPHKDISNDGGVARSHARRAPLATQPYQRSARPTSRKQKKIEDIEDVPAAIAASVRAGDHDVSMADFAGSAVDDLCALFSSTSLNAPAAENAPCDPAPAGANRDAYLPTHVPPRTLTSTPAAPSRRVRAKSVPVRVNPLDRSGRRRGKTAAL